MTKYRFTLPQIVVEAENFDDAVELAWEKINNMCLVNAEEIE